MRREAKKAEKGDQCGARGRDCMQSKLGRGEVKPCA
jgi:hypothetical protein